jgi:hypothetical protein
MIFNKIIKNNDENENLLDENENLLEMTNLLDETENLIDLENNQNENNLCSICLEEHNNTSLKLECGCNNKFHLECINEMKKNNLKKCPLCKKNIFNNMSNNNNTFLNELINGINEPYKSIVVIILTTIGIIYFCAYIYSIFYPIRLIFVPSTFNYCDNIYKKCEYYPTLGILTNNTIVEKIIDFDVKYELYSSYSYSYKNFNKTCLNLESHEYNSFEEINIIYKESIGMKKTIYIPYDDKKECKLYYHWFNENIFRFYFFSDLSSFILIVLLFSLCFKPIIENPNTHSFIKIILMFIHSCNMICYIISLTCLIYYFILTHFK